MSLHYLATRRQRHLSIKLMILSIIYLLALGCNSEPQQQRISYMITAVDTNDLPVSGVYIYLSSYTAVWGTTDSSGRFQGESSAKVGDQVEFRLEAPEGYELIPGGPTSFQVKESAEPIRVNYLGRFKPPERDYLFVVEGKTGDQVLINNNEVTQLGKTKRSMLLYTGAPGEEFIIQVGLDGYQGRLSTEREVYLITPEVQGAIRDPELFRGALLTETESDDTTEASVEIAMPSVQNDQPESEQQRPDFVAPKPRKKKETKRPRRSSRSERTPRSQRSSRRQEETSEPIEIAYQAPKVKRSPPPRSRPRQEESRRPKTVSRTTSSYEMAAPSKGSSYSPPPIRTSPTRTKEPSVTPPRKTVRRSDPPPTKSVRSSTSSSGSSAGDVLSSLKSRKSSSSGSTRPKTRPPASSAPPSRVASMSKSEVKSKLKEVEQRYKRTSRLTAQDVAFLKQLQASHGTSYNYGHRLLGAYYFTLNDIRRQRDSLEIAVKRGRYKSDPVVLLSLAQAHGHFKSYSRALKYLKRAEAKMGRMKGAGKANIYRTYAEYLRLHYLAQRARNPLQADSGLLDLAIQKWSRLRSLSGSSSRDGMEAKKKIAKLEQMKAEAGGP